MYVPKDAFGFSPFENARRIFAQVTPSLYYASGQPALNRTPGPRPAQPCPRSSARRSARRSRRRSAQGARPKELGREGKGAALEYCAGAAAGSSPSPSRSPSRRGRRLARPRASASDAIPPYRCTGRRRGARCARAGASGSIPSRTTRGERGGLCYPSFAAELPAVLVGRHSVQLGERDGLQHAPLAAEAACGSCPTASRTSHVTAA